MHDRIKPLATQVDEFATKWRQLFERWNTAKLPDDKPYARLHGATFQEFDKRVTTIVDLLATVGQMDEAGQLLFLPKVDAALKNVKAAQTSVEQLLAELNSQPLATFTDPSGNLDGMPGLVNGSHVVNVNAGAHLEQVSGYMTALFDGVSSGLRVGKAKGLSLYHGYGQKLQTLLVEATKLHAELGALSTATAKLHDGTKALSVEVAGHAEAGGKAKADAIAALAETRGAQTEAEAKLATIRETAKSAATLQTQVEGYEASFAAFQKLLDERVAQHSSFEKDMVKALSANVAREAEIDRLTQKADSMIRGATTAGLGDSLEKTRKLYQGRMVAAGIAFSLSILLLAASSIPLVAHILPGLFTAWLPPGGMAGANASAANGDAWLSLLGKVFLMFPATWLTQFCSKAYSEFFHLEREYAHKAALARSVEGFKKQAPKYEEEITTAVFFEIQSNPSKQAAPDAAEHPILGPLMKKFIDSLPLGKPSTPKQPTP